MQLLQNELQFLRNREPKVRGIFQQGNAFVREIEEDHGCTQRRPGANYMGIQNVSNTHQHENDHLPRNPAKSDSRRQSFVLNGTHSISASENNGVITITTGKARLSAGTANFNIADTAFYKAAMSARRVDNIIAARLTTPSYDTDTGNISASFRLTAQNGTGDDVTSLGSYDKTISMSGEAARTAGWNGAVATVSLKGRKGSSGSYADIPSTGVTINPGETYNVQARYKDSGGVTRSISRSITAANAPGFDISKLSINLGSDTDATAQTPTKTADRISGKIGIWYDGTYIGELRTFSFTINHGTPYINNHAQYGGVGASDRHAEKCSVGHHCINREWQCDNQWYPCTGGRMQAAHHQPAGEPIRFNRDSYILHR